MINNTDLSKMTVYLNKWSKMNVNCAKAPFSWRTRNALIAYLAETVDCVEDMNRIRGTLSQWKGKMKMYQIEQIKFMKNKIRNNNENKTLYAELSYLELVLHVGLLFNDSLMNSQDNVVGINKLMMQSINEVEKKFREFLKQFLMTVLIPQKVERARKIATMFCCFQRRRGS